MSASNASSHGGPSDSLLINLEILGKVLPGSKIYRDTQTNLLSIEKPKILSGAWRKWQGHGRKQSVLLVSEIVKDATSCTPHPLLIERIKKGANGITCLQQTYQDDLSTESELALLSHKLQAYLTQQEANLLKKCN